ncbi:MAG: GNAT family N-acetyltransferase [Marinilabiliaceae bacterium]|nr:GNAT family N-acetyltransferase [Marinilabiliaceae bacterium]
MNYNKERYKELCEKENSIPLYSQDWWLDIVCGEKNWDIIFFEKEDKIVASMPFYMPLKGIIIMPPFSQNMGIWFNPAFENKNYSKNLLRKQQISDYFINELPPHKVFLQNFHTSYTDWLPFHWCNYKQNTRYNYILPDISNPNLLWDNFNENIRRNIKKAENKHHLKFNNDIPINKFVDIILQTYDRQKIKPFQINLMKKIIEVVRSKKQGDIFGAYDDDNQLHAAVFIVWNNNNAYYIAGGGNSKLRYTSAYAFVFWKIINFLSTEIKTFSFDGSMVKGVENFFRSFGAIQTTYFTIYKGKINIILKILLKITSYLSNN